MGEVIGIATRKKSRASMDTHDFSEITFDKGVGGDFRGSKKGGHRQVTIMSKEDWEYSCSLIGIDAEWTTRRANLLINGIKLENTTGKHLTIGDVKLEITGELTPCNRMDEQFQGLTKALDLNWRGGVTCKVISEGKFKINDVITIN